MCGSVYCVWMCVQPRKYFSYPIMVQLACTCLYYLALNVYVCFNQIHVLCIYQQALHYQLMAMKNVIIQPHKFSYLCVHVLSVVAKQQQFTV